MKDILSKLLKSTALLILIGILSIIILLSVILSKCASHPEGATQKRPLCRNFRY